MSQANGGVRKSQHMGNKRQAKVVNDLTSSWAENSVSIAEVHTHADKEVSSRLPGCSKAPAGDVP